MSDSNDQQLRVEILNEQGVVWEGSALSVSSANTAGAFDLLPGHAHFISLIERAPIVVATESGEKTFAFESAVLRCMDDRVTVYADIK